MPVVGMPDGTQVSFPDEMPADQIKGLIAQKFPNEVKQASPIRDIASGLLGPAGALAGASGDEAKSYGIGVAKGALNLATTTATPQDRLLEGIRSVGAA